jgi:hypothetical protein
MLSPLSEIQLTAESPMELVYRGNTHCQSQNCATHSNFHQNLIKPPQTPLFTAPLMHSKGTPAPCSAPLGKNTKSQSASTYSPIAVRADRYALQDEARKLLPQKSRVAGCLRYRISKITGVQIFVNKKSLVAQYGNVARCGALWTCAVCAAKITEYRKKEVKAAIDSHKANGGAVLLLTLTNSHDVHDKLKVLMLGQKKALAYLWGDRATKAFFAEIGRMGQINAKEVLHGANGWHPHNHILLFIDEALSPEELAAAREKLAVLWILCCKKAGLPLPDMLHGVDLQDGSRADAYIAKWGHEPRWDMQNEMTKGHVKKGKANGRTPFDLLRASSTGDKQAGLLFKEFASAFKHARQLTWSRGLKAKLLKGFDDKTDEEIVAETDEDAEMVLELDVELWRAVVKDGQRANLLAAVEQDPTLQKATELIRQAVQRQNHIVLPPRHT